MVYFRHCITMVLKLAGFKTWFPHSRAAPSREITGGGSGTRDKRFYLSIIKRRCHPPEPASPCINYMQYPSREDTHYP